MKPVLYTLLGPLHVCEIMFGEHLSSLCAPVSERLRQDEPAHAAEPV